MIHSAFIDSDVLLDIALDRNPFVSSSEIILELISQKKISAFTSPIIISNIYYVISKNGSASKARHYVKALEELIEILAVDKKIVKAAIDSDMKDFEDSLQYFCAKENKIQIIIARNKRDFPEKTIKIFTPVEFLEFAGF